MLDLRFIRMKISAGDLPSAESILEVHRAEKGEDAEYLLGLAWLARGAALLGDWPSASRYAKSARELLSAGSARRRSTKTTPRRSTRWAPRSRSTRRRWPRRGRRRRRCALLDESARAQEKAPYNLRARIAKRRNQIELVGRPPRRSAPTITLGAAPPTLESLRGRPACSFSGGSPAATARRRRRRCARPSRSTAPKGVAFVAPTRYYGTEERAEERAKIEKAWKEIYDLPASVTVPIGDAAMLRYGVSATPTFVFIDRKGVVTSYLPYRMTEERLSQAIDPLLR